MNARYYSFIIVMLMMTGMANAFWEAHNSSWSGEDPTTVMPGGFEILVKDQPLLLTKVNMTRQTTLSATSKAWLYKNNSASEDVPLAEAFMGTDYSANFSYTLDASTKYIIVVGQNTSYNSNYNNAGSAFHKIGTYINWSSGISNNAPGTWVYTTTFRGLTAIEVSLLPNLPIIIQRNITSETGIGNTTWPTRYNLTDSTPTVAITLYSSATGVKISTLETNYTPSTGDACVGAGTAWTCTLSTDLPAGNSTLHFMMQTAVNESYTPLPNSSKINVFTKFTPSNNAYVNGSTNTLHINYGLPFSLDCASNNTDAGTNLTLFKNGVVFASDTTSPYNISTTDTISTVTTTTYNCTIYSSTNFNAKNSNNLLVNTTDTTNPVVTLDYPPNAGLYKATSINFSWTTTDDYWPTTNCTINLNGTLHASGWTTNNTLTNKSLATTNDGTYNWNVTCKDNSTNTHTSTTRNFTIDNTPPTITAYTPTNLTQYTYPTTSTLIQFNFTDTSGVNSYNINLTAHNNDGTTTQTLSTNTTITEPANSTSGTRHIQVNVTDNLGNTATYTTNYTILRNTTTTTITINPTTGLYIGQTINITCNTTTNNNTETTTDLYRNGTSIYTASTPYTYTATVASIAENYTCQRNTTTNYNASSAQQLITATPALNVYIVNTYDNESLRTFSAYYNNNGVQYNSTLFGRYVTLPVGTASDTLFNLTLFPTCTRGMLVDDTADCGFYNAIFLQLNNTGNRTFQVNQTQVTYRMYNVPYARTITEFIFNMTDEVSSALVNGTRTISLHPGKQYNTSFTNSVLSTKYVNVTGPAKLTTMEVRINYTYSTDATANQIDNCSVLTTQAINYTIKDRNTTNALFGQMQGYFRTWIDDPTIYKEYNLTWNSINQSNYALCINSSLVLGVYGQLQYDSYPDDTTYLQRTYYYDNATLTTTTTYQDLYLDSNAVQILFNVKDYFSQPVDEAYITILKYDYPTNTYTSDSVIKTGTDGNTIGNARLLTDWYKVLITKDGTTYLSTNPFKFTSTTKNFQINTFTTIGSTLEMPGTINCDITYINNTRTFTYTYTDTTGISRTACLNVRQQNGLTSRITNTTCTSAASAVLTATIPPSTSTGTWVGYGTIVVNGNTLTCIDTATYQDNNDAATYGSTGVIATFLLTLSLSLVGIWSPITAVALTFLGIVISTALGLISITWGVIIGVIGVIAVILMYRLQQK